MRFPRTPRRAGFTLLEVLLASAIAVLLMGGLYVAMQVELRQANEGRDVIEQATIARGIINRLSTDLAPSVTPPGAKPQPRKSTQATGANMTMMAETEDPTATATVIPLQAGVIGASDTLTIFATRVPDPRAVGRTEDGQESPDSPVPGDSRRITYWIGENGGLCRQEIPFFSGDEVRTESGPVIESGKTEDDYVIAREVTALSFEYYDINATTDDGGWGDTWTGSDPGPDGRTPKGPPTAIRVKFTITIKGPDGNDRNRDYSQVIAIVTASGPDSTEATDSSQPTNPTDGSLPMQ